MAVTQPQVCTNSLKFQPRDANTRFRTRDAKPRSLDSFRRLLSRGNPKDLLRERLFMFKLARRERARVVGVKAKARDEDDTYGDSDADDYYSVLGVLPDATPAEIKHAYYSCMKACHPDLSGNNPETTNFCMFVNEVYEVLSDPVQRMVYDEINGYSLTTVNNPFMDVSQPRDHVFVDEFSCIGCKNCANLAPEMFAIEEDFGRARACCQSGNPDLVQQAIDSCPVDCIHWTSAAQLSLLEDEMRRIERVNVGLMLANMGFASPDVFSRASVRWEKRQRRAREIAMIRMGKQNRGGMVQSYWEGLWGGGNRGANSSSEGYSARERASRAAAAARKWREYSRKGVDRRPTCSLPGKKSSVEEQKEIQTV